METQEGIEKYRRFVEDASDLVLKYGGSLSGEHGDGQSRAELLEKMYGPELLEAFREFKRIWDPTCKMNPGKVVDANPILSNLRLGPNYSPKKVETHFQFPDDKYTFDRSALRCVGIGECRKLDDGIMCPSYMVTHEEKHSTRGRSTMLFEMLRGEVIKDGWQSEEVKDALDLCFSCKACKSECPANVDMARMKAEFSQGWHEEHGISLGKRFFAQAAKLYPLASIFPHLSNWILRQPATKELMQRFLGIDKRRNLPAFAEKTFMSWYHNRNENTNPTEQSAAAQKVVLLIDIFTNYHEPEIGKAAVRFLEAKGYDVIVPDLHEVGRPQISKGMLGHAKAILDQNLPIFSAFAEQQIPIVGLEPSEILTLRDEYLDLCDDEQLTNAKKVSEYSYTFEEFAAQILRKSTASHSQQNRPKVYIHGHCHTKALIGNTAIEEMLERTGYEAVHLDTGCCGMAGSFGYETDHYDVSMDIGELRLFPALRSLPDDAIICAPGFSCRHQIKDGTEQRALHPSQLLNKA
jgi:Fe-S oxidoreductase